MLWSSVPQLRWQVARQALVTWLAHRRHGGPLLVQPTIVGYTHDFCSASGFVQSEYDQRVFAQYFSYGWWSLLIAWVTLEVGGFMLVWRYKAKPNEYPEFQARLKRLAEEAGVARRR